MKIDAIFERPPHGSSPVTTQDEWQSSTDPKPMLEFLKGRVADRKLLLFAVSCWDRWAHMLDGDKSRNGIRALEMLADGVLPTNDGSTHLLIDSDGDWAIICGGKYKAGLSVGPGHADNIANFTLDMVTDAEVEELGESSQETCQKCRQAYLPYLKDIFGNPFRLIADGPTWLSETAVSIATGIYEDKAFDRLPILADALQGAGCENEDFLNHLQGDGPHVRGCWALDLVLGKS